MDSAGSHAYNGRKPMRNLRQIDLETTIYLLALMLALGVRLYNLGAAPLTDAEAELALQALQVARPEMAPQAPDFAPYPGYIMLTGVTFSLFGANNFLARLWPALAGALLALLPFYFRRPLGRGAALILAFGLALDPGLVASARMADGPAMAVGFGLSALGLWYAGLPILAGASGALALLSGPAVFAGALGLALAGLAARFLLFKPGAEMPASQSAASTNGHARIALFAGLATFLAVGTLFLRYPQGLAAWLDSLLAYLDGWRTASGVPAARLAAALLFFQPFALIFALAGVLRWLVRLWRPSGANPLVAGLALVWTLTSLALALLYPARQTTDLAWTLVPLWTLAAGELSEYLPSEKPRPISLVQAGLVLLFAGLFWSTLIATDQAVPLGGLPWAALRLAVLAGVVALGLLTSALVALGWSWRASRDGTVWGLSAAFGIYALMVLWSASQLRPHYPQELWSSSPAIQQADLFGQTLDELSKWESGFRDEIEVITTVEAPSLLWMLRDYRNARFLPELPTGNLPGVVITLQEGEFPALSAAYRGQNFAWWALPGWDGVLPPDTLRWLAFHEAPLHSRHIILWGRADVFPGVEPAPEP
jgi:hypothetical protein